jgi:hypothetical protein
MSPVVVQGPAQAPLAALPVLASIAHPDVDVALLQVDRSAADATADGGLSGLVPVAVAGAGNPSPSTGDVIEIAGYGTTEDRTVRSLRLLAEPITAVDATSITVSGFGASGACEGDSGGPLLVRAKDGSAAVLGVLSEGSPTCVGDDTYTRLDSIHDWIESITGPNPSVSRDCGSITEEGRCFYGSAVWCSGAALVAELCSAGKWCGWDRGEWGFRCVEPFADPCGGVDSVGACRSGEALSCAGGILRRQPCTPCDTCRIDGKSGNPMCVIGSE